MRVGDFVEKRRSERLNLSFPVTIKRLSGEAKEEEKLQNGTTINISFNGAYVVDIMGLTLGDKLKISLSVPTDDRRDFPFSRFVGKAMVVRVEKDGFALEFNEDMHRLYIAN